MPLLWKVDDGLIEMDKLPGFLRDRAARAMRDAIKNLKLQGSSALSVGGAVRSADAKALADLKARLTKHPLFVGTLIDPSGKDDGPRRPAQEDRGARRQGHGPEAPRAGRRVRRAAQAGSAGDRGAARPPGRRVHQHRRRRPSAGDRGDGPDRRGHAHGDAEPLVGAGPVDLGVGGLAGDGVGPGHLQHEVVALGRPAGGPDHRVDDAGGQPPGDPLPRRAAARGGCPGRGAEDPGGGLLAESSGAR